MGRLRDKGYRRRHAPIARGWTKAKRAVFLDMLAATCNVSASVRAVGMSKHGVYALRLRDGEFAQLWATAFAIGEERLREELIGAALGQVSTGNNPDWTPQEVETGPFDADLAIKILNMRAGPAKGKHAHAKTMPSQAEVDAMLLARFAELDKRKARLALPAPDDKGAGA